MEQTDFQTELRAAKNIALRTWPLVAPYYDGDIEVEMKENGTPVTPADKAANRFIIEQIRKSFPNDSIVSEEEKAVVQGRRTWYIDPIDGTKGFIKRNGHFAIHIGFCDEENPTLGVVYWPSTGDMYSGLCGIGAWRENSRGILELKLPSIERKNLIASANGDSPGQDLADVFQKLGVNEYHNSGSEGLRLMKLAEGRADIRICESARGTNTWDLCAPHAIVEAAGGIVRYVTGETVIYNGQGRLGKRYFASGNETLARKVAGLMSGSILEHLGKQKEQPLPPSDDEAHYYVYNETCD